MSAWVVSKHHIDLLVSAAIERGIAIKFKPIDETATAIVENAEAIGRMLFAENIRSVIYRYRLSGTSEETEYLLALTDYQFRFYPGVRASAVAQALSCYDYQAFEHPDYLDTDARFFVCQLASAVGEPEGMATEPWGFDSEDAALAASVAQGLAA